MKRSAYINYNNSNDKDKNYGSHNARQNGVMSCNCTTPLPLLIKRIIRHNVSTSCFLKHQCVKVKIGGMQGDYKMVLCFIIMPKMLIFKMLAQKRSCFMQSSILAGISSCTLQQCTCSNRSFVATYACLINSSRWHIFTIPWVIKSWWLFSGCLLDFQALKTSENVVSDLPCPRRKKTGPFEMVSISRNEIFFQTVGQCQLV